MEDTKEPKKKGNKKRKVPTTVFVNVSNTRFSVVRESVEQFGYKITQSTTKNLLFWCDSGGSFEFTSQLSQWQFYNHFPGTWAIARKVDLARNIEKMNRLLPEFYDFHPKSFIIPSQYTEMETYMNSQMKKSKKTFIVKPDRGSFGKGILLIQDPETIVDMYESAIAQQYIEPYLISGLKFDLRIYALVSSIEPLRIYLFNEGIGRFCTEPYAKPKSGNLELSYAHLTNYALNKTNPNFQQPTDADHADSGHKRSLTHVIDHMKSEGIDTDEVISSIEDIIRLTVISIQPLLSTNYRTAIPINDGKSRCFEVLGFDILIDKNYKPWLLEVNWSPSLATESPYDKVLKTNLIQDTLRIINISPNFKQMVNKRRKLISQRRTLGKDASDILDLWDPNEETKISESTRWKQIYPLAHDHPKYEKTEIALNVSKASPVGAAISPKAARVRKEQIIAQLREKNPQQATTNRQSVHPKNKPLNHSNSESINLIPSTNLKSHVDNSLQGTALDKIPDSKIDKPHTNKTETVLIDKLQATVDKTNIEKPPSLLSIKNSPTKKNPTKSQNLNAKQHSSNLINHSSSLIHLSNGRFISLNNRQSFAHKSTVGHSNSRENSNQSLLASFSPVMINDEEERQRRLIIKRQAILASSLNIPSCCALMCTNNSTSNQYRHIAKNSNTMTTNIISMPNQSVQYPAVTTYYPSRPSQDGNIKASLKSSQSIAKFTATQSIFKPMVFIQKQPIFC